MFVILQAAIWDGLNHYAYNDATFLAERLYSEVSSEEALYLLATCYFRSGKPIQAYMLLHKCGCPSPKCKFLMARCCMEINKLPEAEEVLAGNILSKSKSFDELEQEFGSMACHVFSLLGAMYSKTERTQKALDCYRKCLKLNPLLWSAYEKLCQLGEKVDPSQVFQVPSQKPSTPAPQMTQITEKVVNTCMQTPVANLSEVLKSVSDVSQTSIENKQQTPLPQCTITYSTPECLQDLAPAIPPRLHRKKPLPLLGSPLSPSFGILPIDTPSPQPQSHTLPFITPSPVAFSESNNTLEIRAPSKKPVTRRSQNQNQNPMPKPPVFSVSGNTNTRDIHNSQTGLHNNPPQVRRSSRLFGSNNSSSVKENNKSQGNKSGFQSPKTVGRKSKTRSSKSQQELNEINKAELSTDTKPQQNPEVPTQHQIMQMQHQSLSGILHLLQMVGKAYQALAQYDCRKAISYFQELPVHQYNTGWVLCHVGRAYSELAEYSKAEKIFSKVRRIEPYRLEGMEIYSTTLWHLQKEVELSTLAQELTEMDKNSAEAWCATGNCFSLHKEHDTAVKFFERSIQVNPNFSYAYTLLGHEYVFTEELDKAMSCFRNAIRVDPRHYNAWYGLGMIYYKQEKFSLAEVHFRRALLINPQSSVLLCHVGVVQHAQQKSDHALITLNKAIAAEPQNPLCKFHRASILLASDKHKEALAELEELKQIVPKESLVYFLIGKVHKKLGNTHLALMNFSWAMDLDPKGINNQIKEAVDKRHVTEDDDAVARLNSIGLEDDLGLDVDEPEAGPGIDQDDLQLQAIESDESL